MVVLGSYRFKISQLKRFLFIIPFFRRQCIVEVIMIEKLSRRDNRTETREFLFERLEAKIAILRKLWSVAQVLSAPEAGESSELTEKLFLAKIFSEARDKFPLAEREFGEYEQIKKSL